jgi:hypothetical protein
MKRTKEDYSKNFLFVAVAIFLIGGLFLGVTLIQHHSPSRGLASDAKAPINLEEALMQKIQVANTGELSNVRFPLVDKSGENVCKKYDQIAISFAAEGVAVNGDRPIVKLELDCKLYGEKAFVDFAVPNQQKSKRKPSSVKIDEHAISISFHHVSWVWPDTWALSEVEYRSEAGDFAPIRPKHQSDIKRIQW